MILFVIIAIGIFIYTIFAKEWLIESIKGLDEYNKNIDRKIKYEITKDTFLSFRKYDKRDYDSVPKLLLTWFFGNIVLNCINFVVVLLISIIIVCTYPRIPTEYSFNINSLKDNLVASGEIHGGMFCVSGSIDGEISYFFSRTMNEGEKIEHIPAKDTYIKYDNKSKPHIEVHQTTHEFPVWLENLLFVKEIDKNITEYYVVVVPEGTISTNGTYQNDME